MKTTQIVASALVLASTANAVGIQAVPDSSSLVDTDCSPLVEVNVYADCNNDCCDCDYDDS